MRPAGLFILLAALTGCPTNALPTGQSYFDKPFFQLAVNNNNQECLQVYVAAAVNADGGPAGSGQGWEQLTCLSQSQGFFQTQTLSIAQMMQIQAAFALLPPQPDPSCTNDQTPSGAAITLRQATATSDITWTACVSSADGGVALAEPYSTIATTLQGLVQTPQQ